MKRFKSFSIFACLLVFALSIGMTLVVKPLAASADPVAPSKSVPTSAANYIIVDVKVNNIDGNVPATFAGDKIVQSGNSYYLMDSSGNPIAEIPSTLNLEIVDAGDGVQLPTYCNTDSSGNNRLPCGGDSITLDTDNGLTISAEGVIQYSAYFSVADDQATNAYKNSTSKYIDNYIACPQSGSGVTLTDVPACTTNYLADLTDWTVSSGNGCTTELGNAVGAGYHNACGNGNGSNGILLSLPLGTNYVAPPLPAGSPTSPTTLACTGGGEPGVNGLCADGTAPTLQTNPGGGSGGTPTCTSTGGEFSWIFCSIINYISDAEQDLEKVVDGMLQTPPQALNSSDPIYKVWTNFRVYGNVVLVIALLAVVFAEAIGGGLIDAYTAKKMLPRILVAVILINLSIYIVAALEDVFNIFGRGIEAIVSTPFQGVTVDGHSAWVVSVGGVAGTTGLGISAIAATALLAGFAAGGQYVAMFMLLIVVPMILAVLGVVITLIIRTGLLAFLVISAPVAFALYALPNTEQYFRKWWSLLIKTLLVFPIVSIIFAMANVTAVLLSGPLNAAVTAGTVPQWLAQSMGVLALIAPLFLIPFAFRLAGGAMGAVAGGINKVQGGMRKRSTASGLRHGQNLVTMARTGGFHDRGLGAVYNRIGRGANAGFRGRFGFGATGRAHMAGQTMANNEEALKGNALLRELRNNDDANNIMGLSGGTRDGARQAARDLFTDENGVYDEARAERALAAADAVGYSRQNAAAAFQTSSQNKWRAVGAGRVDILQNGLERLAGGNAEEASAMAYNAQYFNREAGRGDLGGAWHQENIQARTAGLVARGMTQQQALTHITTLDALDRTEVPAMLRGHPNQIRQYTDTIRTMMAYGTPEERELAAQRLLEFQKNINFASGEGQRIINDTVGQFVNPESSVSVEEQLARATRIRGLSGMGLSRAARTYDRETGREVPGFGQQQPPPPPP